MQTKTIIVTGGAGYIGSYVCRELFQNGYNVVVVDDLSTGRLEGISGSNVFIEGDFADENIWDRLLGLYKPYAVMHLAAKIDVAESLRNPDLYLETNYLKSKQLYSILSRSKVEKLITASSAAVYGDTGSGPITENSALGPLNPYGESKLRSEEALRDYAQNGRQAIALRFFNVSGALPEVGIKSDNTTSLLAKLGKAAAAGDEFCIYGDDYETSDGTCVRDLIHVQDVARACAEVISKIDGHEQPFEAYNVGTGRGYSVKQVVREFEKALEKQVNVRIAPRREGEIYYSVADTSKLRNRFGFEPRYSDLETIIKTSL